MVKDTKTEKTTNDDKVEKLKDYIFAVGRRKSAVARVRLYPKAKTGIVINEQTLKNGDILVNGKPIETYFSFITAKAQYTEPLRSTNTLNRVALSIKVQGGGQAGQLEAVVMGMARALSEHNKTEFRPILKKRGLLSRNPRVRERRKIGTGGKARRKKQSPKR